MHPLYFMVHEIMFFHVMYFILTHTLYGNKEGRFISPSKKDVVIFIGILVLI